MLTFKQEFQLKNFKFDYKPVSHFSESSWFPTPVVIVYRSVFFLYSLSWIIYRLIAHERFRRLVVLFYLTNWSYFILILYFLVSAVVTIIQCLKKKKEQAQTADSEKGHVDDAPEGETRWFYKIQWLLYSISASMSIGVTVFYWAFDYDGMGIDLSDVNVHLLNAVFMLIEHSLSSMPVRLFHMVYPMAFTFLYMIATMLYWLFISKDYIYKKMDYSTNPVLAITLLLVAKLIGAPVIHSFYYVTYRLREYVASKRRQDVREKVEEEMEEGKALDKE